MRTHGLLAPTTADEVREIVGTLEPAARTVVTEASKAMGFDRGELDRRLTDDVVTTARDALFGSLLEVRVGTRAEFDEWVAETDLEVVVVGSEQVDRVVWHAAPAAGIVVAATFQDREAAAIGALRRQAYGRAYAELV